MEGSRLGVGKDQGEGWLRGLGTKSLPRPYRDTLQHCAQLCEPYLHIFAVQVRERYELDGSVSLWNRRDLRAGETQQY